jgi:hypothetical protein
MFDRASHRITVVRHIKISTRIASKVASTMHYTELESFQSWSAGVKSNLCHSQDSQWLVVAVMFVLKGSEESVSRFDLSNLWIRKWSMTSEVDKVVQAVPISKTTNAYCTRAHCIYEVYLVCTGSHPAILPDYGHRPKDLK